MEENKNIWIYDNWRRGFIKAVIHPNLLCNWGLLYQKPWFIQITSLCRIK
jgi:hypothetical protein